VTPAIRGKTRRAMVGEKVFVRTKTALDLIGGVTLIAKSPAFIEGGMTMSSLSKVMNVMASHCGRRQKPYASYLFRFRQITG